MAHHVYNVRLGSALLGSLRLLTTLQIHALSLFHQRTRTLALTMQHHETKEAMMAELRTLILRLSPVRNSHTSRSYCDERETCIDRQVPAAATHTLSYGPAGSKDIRLFDSGVRRLRVPPT